MKSTLSVCVLAGACLVGALAAAQPTTPAPDAARDSARRLLDVKLPGLAFVERDGAVRLVVDGTVVLREADWLELLACSPDSREHESILTVDALPSQIHLALTMLGLQPGEPLQSRMEDGEWVADPPTGPKIAVHVAWQDEAGEEQMVPAGRWVVNRETDEALGDEPWLFTGSRFQPFQGKDYYMADHNGTVISLVNFGDDLLARPTLVTNQTDEQMWGANTDQIPPVGTRVKIHLVPVAEEAAAKQ